MLWGFFVRFCLLWVTPKLPCGRPVATGGGHIIPTQYYVPSRIFRPCDGPVVVMRKVFLWPSLQKEISSHIFFYIHPPIGDNSCSKIYLKSMFSMFYFFSDTDHNSNISDWWLNYVSKKENYSLDYSYYLSITLISLLNGRGGWNKRGECAKVTELINEKAGINVEGGSFWKK